MRIGSLSLSQRYRGTASEMTFSSFLSMMKKVLSFPRTPGFSSWRSSVSLFLLPGRCWFID